MHEAWEFLVVAIRFAWADLLRIAGFKRLFENAYDEALMSEYRLAARFETVELDCSEMLCREEPLKSAETYWFCEHMSITGHRGPPPWCWIGDHQMTRGKETKTAGSARWGDVRASVDYGSVCAWDEVDFEIVDD